MGSSTKEYEKQAKLTLVLNELQSVNLIVDNHPVIKGISFYRKKVLRNRITDKRRVRRLVNAVNNLEYITEGLIEAEVRAYIEFLYKQYLQEQQKILSQRITKEKKYIVSNYIEDPRNATLTDLWGSSYLEELISNSQTVKDITKKYHLNVLDFNNNNEAYSYYVQEVHSYINEEFNKYVYFINTAQSIGIGLYNPLEEYEEYKEELTKYVHYGYQPYVDFLSYLYLGTDLVNTLDELEEDRLAKLNEELEQEQKLKEKKERKKLEREKRVREQLENIIREERMETTEDLHEKSGIVLPTANEEEYVTNVDTPVLDDQKPTTFDINKIQAKSVYIPNNDTFTEDEVRFENVNLDLKDVSEDIDVIKTELKQEQHPQVMNTIIEEDIFIKTKPVEIDIMKEKLRHSFEVIYSNIFQNGGYTESDKTAYLAIESYVKLNARLHFIESNEDSLFVKFGVDNDIYIASPFFMMSERPFKLYYDTTDELEIDAGNVFVPTEHSIKDEIVHIVMEYVMQKDVLGEKIKNFEQSSNSKRLYQLYLSRKKTLEEYGIYMRENLNRYELYFDNKAYFSGFYVYNGYIVNVTTGEVVYSEYEDEGINISRKIYKHSQYLSDYQAEFIATLFDLSYK